MRRTTVNRIADEWLAQVKSKRNKEIEGEAGRIFYQDKVIYSYGHHFPMAVIMEKADETPFILINADTWGSYTSAHQRYVQDAVRQDGRAYGYTSFSALEQAGLLNRGHGYSNVSILDTTGDRDIERIDTYWEMCRFYNQDPRGECSIPRDLHRQRKQSSRYSWREGRYDWYHKQTQPRSIHLMGSLLFAIEEPEREIRTGEELCFDEGCPKYHGYYDNGRNHNTYEIKPAHIRHFLSGIDETASNPWRGFFLTELDRPCSTVAEAIESMKHPLVAEVEEHADPKPDIIRQGEWFFVAVAETAQVDLTRRERELERVIDSKTKTIQGRGKEINDRIEEIARLTGHIDGTQAAVLEHTPEWNATRDEYFALREELRTLHQDNFNLKAHRMALLPKREWQREQRHRVTRLLEVSDPMGLDTTLYARGMVRHTGGDHRTIKLGDGKSWYMVLGNQQVRSWSLGNGDRRARID